MSCWDETYITATEIQTSVRGVYPFQKFAWVAKILGLHPSYLFDRLFLPGHRRLRPCPDDPSARCGTIHWMLDGPGIYEFRGFVTGLVGGEGSEEWFFEVTETGLGRHLWEYTVHGRFMDTDEWARQILERAERERRRR